MMKLYRCAYLLGMCYVLTTSAATMTGLICLY